jgi:hypothetical protein
MRGTKHLTAEQIQALPEMYRTHLTVVATAAAMDVSPVQVRHNLKRLGIPLNGAKSHGACYQHADEVRRLAAEGVSFAEIGRRIGTTGQRVGQFLRRFDIPYTPFEQSGPNNPAWRGGRVIDADGYVLVKRSDHPRADRHGYVREHRLVMESVLGRYLGPDEIVHHKDGDKQNNAPENLEVFGSNGDHLAETLKGRVPQWTPDGQRRIREAAHTTNSRRKSSRAA